MVSLTFTTSSPSWKDALLLIEEHRVNHPYRHKYCSQDCEARGSLIASTPEDSEMISYYMCIGCGSKKQGGLLVLDGIWKLAFPHCMLKVTNTVNKIPLLHYPDVCPQQPKPHHAFCSEHCSVATELGIPTVTQQFLKYCSTSHAVQMEGIVFYISNNFYQIM